MADQIEEITEDQATDALNQMIAQETPVESPEVPVPAAPVQAEPPAEDAGTVEAGTDGEQVVTPEGDVPAEVEPAAPADDVESLLTRNKELEKAAEAVEKKNEARFEALKQRNRQSEGIMRDRLLRKSTLSDRMAQTLRKSRSAEGVPEAEVEQALRDFDGSLNPASASYVPPQPAMTDGSDKVLVLNEFLNEKGMDLKEQDEFSNWIQSEATTVMSQEEQSVANESLGGFLRLAHFRWQAGVQQKAADKKTKRSDTVETVRSVKRTQREAAKAASPTTVAPKTKPVSRATELDLDKLTDTDISTLLRKSVEESQ